MDIMDCDFENKESQTSELESWGLGMFMSSLFQYYNKQL